MKRISVFSKILIDQEKLSQFYRVLFFLIKLSGTDEWHPLEFFFLGLFFLNYTWVIWLQFSFWWYPYRSFQKNNSNLVANKLDQREAISLVRNSYIFFSYVIIIYWAFLLYSIHFERALLHMSKFSLQDTKRDWSQMHYIFRWPLSFLLAERVARVSLVCKHALAVGAQRFILN